MNDLSIDWPSIAPLVIWYAALALLARRVSGPVVDRILSGHLPVWRAAAGCAVAVIVAMVPFTGIFSAALLFGAVCVITPWFAGQEDHWRARVQHRLGTMDTQWLVDEIRREIKK